MTKQMPKRSPAVSGVSRPGVYSRGSDTVDAILKAALHILIEEGMASFTLRRIAQECEMKVGNVSRHFPRKEMLVQVLLEEILQPSEGLIEQNIRRTGMTAEDALILIIRGSLDQISEKKYTNLFIELWAMANHNDFVADRVEASYRYMIDLVASFVQKLNPALDIEGAQAVSLYINASIEGATMLAGFEKPWSAMMPQMRALAVRSLVHLAKTITPEELRALTAEAA